MTLIAIGCCGTTVRIATNTTVGTVTRTPCTVGKALLGTSINSRTHTTGRTVVVSLATVCTLAVTTAEATTRTSVRLPVTIHIDTRRFTIGTLGTLTIIGTGHLAGGTLAIRLG